MSVTADFTNQSASPAGCSSPARPMDAECNLSQRPRVLVVDDDPSIRDLVALVVVNAACRPLLAETVTEALDLLDRERISLIVSDLTMPGLDGLHLLAELSARPAPPPVLVITGSGDEATLRAATLLGARRVIAKPFSVRELRDAIDDIAMTRQQAAA